MNPEQKRRALLIAEAAATYTRPVPNGPLYAFMRSVAQSIREQAAHIEVLEARLAAQRAPLPSDWKPAPINPTPEMVEAAAEAYMPFGDMELAVQMAIQAAPQPPEVAQARPPLAVHSAASAGIVEGA